MQFRDSGETFQFHKGTIRTSDITFKRFLETYFNSIKVRLEHNYGGYGIVVNDEFQFHKGTIRTNSYL